MGVGIGTAALMINRTIRVTEIVSKSGICVTEVTPLINNSFNVLGPIFAVIGIFSAGVIAGAVINSTINVCWPGEEKKPQPVHINFVPLQRVVISKSDMIRYL